MRCLFVAGFTLATLGCPEACTTAEAPVEAEEVTHLEDHLQGQRYGPNNQILGLRTDPRNDFLAGGRKGYEKPVRPDKNQRFFGYWRVITDWAPTIEE